MDERMRIFKKRLPSKPGELIDRNISFTFTFDGKAYPAHPGDTIASALAAAGVHVFSRSFKYHRPRGLMCCAGHCSNCLVQVGDEPNVRACREKVEPGMKVDPQNAWPSLKRDAMSLTALAGRLTPVGFYYKTFIRPQALWPAYEWALRHVAGLGRIDGEAAAPEGFSKQYLHSDVVVVGGGPAGLSAAVAAAEQGATVLLVDENPVLGGHASFTGDEVKRSAVDDLRRQALKDARITAIRECTVLGYWEDHWLSAVAQCRFYKIRAKSVVFATGAYERPLVFDDNDLPGVMFGSGVQRMLHLYGVSMGQKAVVVTANDEGWRVAADLQSAGVKVSAVVDERPERQNSLTNEVVDQGAVVAWGHTVLAAQGRGQVDQVTIAAVTPSGEIGDGTRRVIPCDLLVVSAGWTPANGLLYQAGAQIEYNQSLDVFRPEELPPGIFAAGRVAGEYRFQEQLTGGELTGRRAAAHAGAGEAPDLEPLSAQIEETAGESRDTRLVAIPGHHKRFLCFCEDVTEEDLQTSIAEGYDSIELLKRYSTISMGPCQGKMCSLNTIHLCARANDATISETGTTVSRPPVIPVSLAALAGQNMEPVKYTPVHSWHLAHGAKMMVAGQWLRAEHYGDATAEVNAVRQRVGLIDVSTLGKLRLTGPGVPDLLDKIYLNKWQKLGIGRVRYGVMCNDEGIVMDDGVTARLGEREWYMTTTSSGARGIYEWIQWWAQSGWGGGVNVTNVTDDWAAFNLAGPRARLVLQKATDGDLSQDGFPYMHVRPMGIAGVPCRLLRIGFTGELSYEIHCPAGYALHVWEALMSAGREVGITPFGVEAQRVLRLEKGHIIIGQDTDALSDPISADLGWVVKLDKGDFLGKRPLARISANGSKQRLVGFKMVDPSIVPEEGLQIVRQQDNAPTGLEIIGWVTSSRFSPTLAEAIGLCWLPAEMAEKPGTRFSIRREGQLIEAAVYHAPFYDPEGHRLRI